jgi:hypothetical protein
LPRARTLDRLAEPPTQLLEIALRGNVDGGLAAQRGALLLLFLQLAPADEAIARVRLDGVTLGKPQTTVHEPGQQLKGACVGHR